MASVPDGDPECTGGAPGTDYPLDYDDTAGHHTDDEDETEEEEQMDVGAVEGDLTDETTTEGCGPSDSEMLKERTHGSIITIPTDGHFTASEKAKKFIAENRSGCGGAGKNMFSLPSRNKNTAVPPLPPAHGENNLRYRTGSEGSGMEASGLIDFPPQFYTIRASRERTQNNVVLGAVHRFGREERCSERSNAGFRVENDARCFKAMNFHRTDVKRNVSASVTVDLECLSCENQHCIKNNINNSNPVVVVLTDQAFPPVLPAKDNKCVVVIRVEDGYLSEIENSFCDIFVEFLRPNGSLPNGSVILIGSLSHLGARGLGGYTADLVSSISSLGALVGAGSEVIPAVPVPIGGVGGSGLIRDILDFDAWLQGSAVGPGARLDSAREAFWEVVRETGQGTQSVHGERTLYIPTSSRKSEENCFRLSCLGCATSIPHPTVVGIA